MRATVGVVALLGAAAPAHADIAALQRDVVAPDGDAAAAAGKTLGRSGTPQPVEPPAAARANRAPTKAPRARGRGGCRSARVWGRGGLGGGGGPRWPRCRASTRRRCWWSTWRRPSATKIGSRGSRV